LKPNHKINNLVQHFKALGGVFTSTNDSSVAPASSGAASPRQDNSQIANSQDKEMAIEREPLPSTELAPEEELDFGPAWHAVLQEQAPPTTLEELDTLKEEIALLESALQLCQTMPCAGENTRHEEKENDDLQQRQNKQESQQQQQQQQQRPTSSGAEGISFNGKAAALIRKQARKLSEFASQQHNSSSGHNTQEEQKEAIPCTEETTKDEVAATTEALEDEGAMTAPAPAAAATAIPDRHPLHQNGADPPPKRPRIEQLPTEAALGIIPDSQPSVEETPAAATAAAGNLRGASDGAGILAGSSAAPLNTQSAAELLDGLANRGFVPASQLPLDHGINNDSGVAAAVEEAAAAVKRPHIDEEECIQPFGLAFPAPEPRSCSQSVGASPFFSAGPSNNFLNSNDKSKHTGSHYSKPLPIVPSRNSTPTASQSGKINGTNGPKSDIRALLLSQKAAQEALPSQTPICLAFARNDPQLKEKVEAVQRKIPSLRYNHEVSEATTHVIVDTDNSLIADKRNRIYLEALACGCWVVSIAWLEACLDTGIRVKENIYEVKGCSLRSTRFYKDDWLVANVLGGPERSRLLAKQNKKLFASVPKIIRVENFEEKPKNAGRLRDVVLCLLRFAGATVTERGPCNQESIIVTNDKNVAGGFLTGGYRHVVDARWVLDSVSCCRVLPESQYLFKREVE